MVWLFTGVLLRGLAGRWVATACLSLEGLADRPQDEDRRPLHTARGEYDNGFGDYENDFESGR